jgi:phage terminase large subunit GpA-like protein
VRAARVESWVHITEALFETAYKKRNGEVLKVRMACLDSGYNTDEVYLICRRYSHVARAIKGDIRVTGVPISSPSRIDRYVGSGSVIPGGLSLYRLDVNYFKDKVFRLVHSEAGDLSKWHNFKNVSEQYLKQFCSEDKVILRDRKTGRAQEIWKPKANKTPNHYWDAEIYAVAAAEMIHVSSMRDPAKQKVYSTTRESDGSYLGKLGQMRKNWLKQ